MQTGDLVCLMCGAVVGELRRGRFEHHAGCQLPIRWQGRLPRCCRCGGSLFVDPGTWTPRLAGRDEATATALIDA